MKAILLFIFILFSFPIIAQEAAEGQPPKEETRLFPLEFNEEKLKEYRNDPAYDYSEAAAKDNWWSSFKRYLKMQWHRFMDWLFGDFEMPFVLALLIDILPYLLLAGLIGLVLYLFSKLNPASYHMNNQKGEVFHGEDEKIVKSKDIQKMIEKAVANGNFRLAVRYHFLFVLQQLSRKQIIVYDNTKTDEEYLQEIENTDLKMLFRRLNYLYDFIWYGHFDATASDYEKIKKEFQKMEGSIKV